MLINKFGNDDSDNYYTIDYRVYIEICAGMIEPNYIIQQTSLGSNSVLPSTKAPCL